ncbi:NAD(P)H-dependent oxidoreductase [Niallia sp. FSL M8-0099]|jgi:NAD(P)H dehydrogenase (quinone)|uniref:NAD(P)H-dependent oxidoreductase n=1 Tax=Niallia sp. FSL M8-0099 TaxID=2954519 RepID=UPI0030F76BAC
MNVLIIFTHPSKESLKGALLKNVLEGCRENGFIKDIQLLDLYEENFNPFLYFDEKNKRRHMHKNLMKKTYFNL